MKEITKEAFTVMIGILLALLINNWNDERKEKNYLEQIYVSMQHEMEERIEEIDDKLPLQLGGG